MAEANQILGPVDKPITFSAPKTEKPKLVSPGETKFVAAEPAKTPPPEALTRERTSWQTSSEIDELIKSLAGQNSRISISMDAQTNRIVVEVVDVKSGAIIRKVPPENLVHLMNKMRDLSGMSLDLMA